MRSTELHNGDSHNFTSALADTSLKNRVSSNSYYKLPKISFLSKPQAWHEITLQRVWNRRRRMASPKVHFPRLDSIPSCDGFPVPMQPYTDRMTSKTPDTIIVKLFPSDEDCKNTFDLLDDAALPIIIWRASALTPPLPMNSRAKIFPFPLFPTAEALRVAPKPAPTF